MKTTNQVRIQTVSALKAGAKDVQAFEILRFLARRKAGANMNAIVAFMTSKGHEGRTYYDACNSLTDVKFITKVKVGRSTIFTATEKGIAVVRGA